MMIAVIPVGKEGFNLSPSDQTLKKLSSEAQKFFHDYSLLVFPGVISGYIVETGEKSVYQTIQKFNQEISQKTKVNRTMLNKNLMINYLSLGDDRIEMQYRPDGLRCNAAINGERQDWDNFTKSAVYHSPYLKIKSGIMSVSDGNSGYVVDFRGANPVYTELKYNK